MDNQPFDNYKNKGVEYDYILKANVKVGIIDNIIPDLIKILSDEDFMKIYFPDIALGRIYGKVDYQNEYLQFTFGISLVDSVNIVTSKELSNDIKEFILSLNKNIETPKLNIKESDIKVEIMSENKNYLDSIDKTLVNEGKVSFGRLNEVQTLELTSDGIVERYINGSLSNTMPFSKLGVVRECKGLVADGYSLIWRDLGTGNLNEATITPMNSKDEISLNKPLDNPEETKQELQQEIQDVEEIQDLKDELEDKLDTLNENENNEEDYVLVIYTNIDGNFTPDVCVREVNGENYVIADDIADAGKYSKEEADKIVDLYNSYKENSKQHILKAVKIEDVNTLKGLYENKKVEEDNEEDITDNFPSSDITEKELTKKELGELKLYDVLSVEQINWVQDNIGTVEEIVDAIKNMLVDIDDSFNEDETVMSIDKYVENLHNALKGE